MRKQKHISRRRSMLKYGASIGMLPVIGGVYIDKSFASSRITPAQTEGPFYPIHKQLDKDADLTRIEGRENQAKGTVINILGRVLSPEGQALPKAVVEIWQANAYGRYRHVRDPNPAKPDPDFQGWGISRTDEQGFYRFRTILPGAYPAGPGWMRPPHIHFKVMRQDYRTLTTQMYFPQNRYNQDDLILQNLSKADQQMVISKLVEKRDGFNSYQFDIVLQSK